MAVIVREKVKGSGEWWVFINHKGKRTSKKVGSKTAANAVKRTLDEELANGALGLLQEKESMPTLAEFGEKSIEDRTEELAANTRASYRHLFRNHIQGHSIGALPLDQMKPHHCKDFITSLKRKKLAPGTIKFIVAILHGILEDAREYEYVIANPCSRAGKWIKGGKKTQKGVKPLEMNEAYTKEEAAEVIELSKSIGLWFHALIVVAIRAGLRPGEILGLSWGNVDFENRKVLVKHNWNYTHKELGPTKTRTERRVDLTPYTVEVLEQLKEQTEYWRPKDPVFCNDKGKRLKNERVRNMYYKIRLREPVKLRNLRHTYATIRIAAGHNIVDVSKQLGHENITMTLQRYTLWDSSEHKHEIDELDSLHLAQSAQPHRNQSPTKPVLKH